MSHSVSFTYLAVFCLLPQICGAQSSTPTPVRVGTVRAGSGAWGKAFIGSVQPARRSIVGTAVAGRIEKVDVEPGDFVKADGRLAQLRLTSIEIRVAAASADHEAAKQALEELITGPRKEDLQRLEARAKGAAAVLLNATKRFERLEELSKRGATPRGELDQAISAREAAAQNHVAAEAEHAAAIAGTREEQLAQSRALAEKAAAEVDRMRNELDEHTIRAPFNGYLVKRLAEKGEWVGVGDPVAEVIELDPAEVRVAVPEEYIGRLSVGAEVRVVIDAITSRENPKDLRGAIFRIVPDADARSRSFPVRIRIDNPNVNGQPRLKPGMLARVFLPVGKPETVMLIPQDALVLDRNRAFVFAVDTNVTPNIARQVEVETGPTKDAMIQVKPRGRNMISAGTKVVVEGNERLTSGQAVKPL